MDFVKESKSKRYLYNIIVSIISIAIIVALIWRIQRSISYYDEVLNIYTSYITAALGRRHLVENGYIFSMGDVFNLPFVYLFYRFTGGTEGIVLFIRFVYLGFNLLLAGVFFSVFKNKYDRKILLLFGLIFITFFPGGMYTVSYDTVAMFFSLIGGLLLLGSEVRGNEKAWAYRYFAGICHACMVYAYPLMASVIILIFIGITIFHIKGEHMKMKELWKYWLPYFWGGMTVVVIFLTYVFYVGWENIIFFQDGYIQSHIGGREIGELSSVVNDTAILEQREGVASSVATENSIVVQVSHMVSFAKSIIAQILALLNYMWIQQKATLGVTLLMLLQWGIGLHKKGKWRLLLVPEIMLVAYFMHTGITCFGGTTMYAYCFCWAPFLYFYLDKEEREQGKVILLVLGLISIASFLAIGFTSVRTDKAHVGLYCGAICTFIFMVMIVRKEHFREISLGIPVVLLIAVCNIGMAYIDHYQGAEIEECTYKMQEGVYKGLWTWEEDIKYEHLKLCFEQLPVDKGTEMLLINPNDYAAGMDGEFIIVESGMLLEEEMLRNGEAPSVVFARDTWPKVVILGKQDEETYTNIKKKILDEYYSLFSAEYEYYIYIKETE